MPAGRSYLFIVLWAAGIFFCASIAAAEVRVDAYRGETWGVGRVEIQAPADQANLAAGSDSLAVQQQAQDSSADAVVAGAAGAAAFLARSTRAALRDAARRDGAS